MKKILLKFFATISIGMALGTANKSISQTTCTSVQTCAVGVSEGNTVLCTQACPPPGCPTIQNCANGWIDGGVVYCRMGKST